MRPKNISLKFKRAIAVGLLSVFGCRATEEDNNHEGISKISKDNNNGDNVIGYSTQPSNPESQPEVTCRYFNDVKFVPGKNLPDELEDLTLHLFLQVHDQDTAAPNDFNVKCQLAIYRQLEELYNGNKISGVFFEGYRVGFDYVQNLRLFGWSEEKIRKRKREISNATDGTLKAMFSVERNEFGDHNDASELFPIAYDGRDDLLITGWEDNPYTQEELAMQEATVERYSKLDKKDKRTRDEELEYQSLGTVMMQFDFRTMDRTRQAYNNSWVTMATLLTPGITQKPKLNHGYAIIIGSAHGDVYSLHGSAESDIKFPEVHPKAWIYKCEYPDTDIPKK